MAARMLLSSSFFLLAWLYTPILFFKNLRPTCLWRLGATFYGVLLMWDKAAHFFDHILHELGVLGEAPLVVAVWPACVLGHLVGLVKAHGYGAA